MIVEENKDVGHQIEAILSDNSYDEAELEEAEVNDVLWSQIEANVDCN